MTVQELETLTLIAGKCLAGLLSNPSVVQSNSDNGWDIANATPEQVADMAWDCANEIMKLRARS